MDQKTRHNAADRTLLLLGCLLLALELWKQLYLYTLVFHGHYNMWYVPFQLCSTPMYLCLLRFFLPNRSRLSLLHALDSYLRTFALLGGIAALAVPDGFTWPAHPLLTAHGYLWHVLLIAIALILGVQYVKKPVSPDAGSFLKGFLPGCGVFLALAAVAEVINLALHPYGDCDMFYISPYHLSSQPVFHQIDAQIGRPLGIVLYLFTVILGAFLLHLLWWGVKRLRCRKYTA